jgi:hypothetical protein
MYAACILACLYWGYKVYLLRIFCIYSFVAVLAILNPLTWEILLKITRVTTWRLLYSCPLPFIMSILCIAAADYILMNKKAISLVLSIIITLIIVLKVSSYTIHTHNTLTLSMPSPMKYNEETRKLLRYIDRLNIKEGIVLAAFAPRVIGALGAYIPNLRFLTIAPGADGHFLRNSPHASELQPRKQLNAYLNQGCEGEVPEEMLDPYIHRISVIAVPQCRADRLDAFLARTTEYAWEKHTEAGVVIYRRLSAQGQTP